MFVRQDDTKNTFGTAIFNKCKESWSRDHGQELCGTICAFTNFIEYSLAFLRIASISPLLLIMERDTTRSYANARYFLQVSHFHGDRAIFILSTASLRSRKATVQFPSVRPRRVPMQESDARFLFLCHSCFTYVPSGHSLCLSTGLYFLSVFWAMDYE